MLGQRGCTEGFLSLEVGDTSPGPVTTLGTRDAPASPVCKTRAGAATSAAHPHTCTVEGLELAPAASFYHPYKKKMQLDSLCYSTNTILCCL